jgi:hypothetical protein
LNRRIITITAESADDLFHLWHAQLHLLVGCIARLCQGEGQDVAGDIVCGPVFAAALGVVRCVQYVKARWQGSRFNCCWCCCRVVKPVKLTPKQQQLLREFAEEDSKQ